MNHLWKAVPPELLEPALLESALLEPTLLEPTDRGALFDERPVRLTPVRALVRGSS